VARERCDSGGAGDREPGAEGRPHGARCGCEAANHISPAGGRGGLTRDGHAVRHALGLVVERLVRDQQVAGLPENVRTGIKRSSLIVGGEPAEQVVGLPSQAGDIETFVVHNNQLYHIVLEPYDERNDSLKPYLAQVRTVYDGVLVSLKFLK